MKIKDLVFNEFNEAVGFKGVFKINHTRENGYDYYWFEINGGNEEGEAYTEEEIIRKANNRNKRDIEIEFKKIKDWEEL